MQIPKLQIIRKNSFTATPWKNGGGITHEAIRVPPTGDPFRWRVSVAHIETSGPFSEFADYNRKMVLLKGNGIKLTFGDDAHKILSQVGDLVEFDGALSTQCELLKSPCVDLNLMVSKSDAASARVERLMDSLVVNAGQDETVLIFAIDDGLTLEINTGKSVALEPWDLVVMSNGGGRLYRLPTNQSASTAVFLATLGFC